MYEVFYKDILIGTLTINEAGLYCYLPDEAGVAKTKEETYLDTDLINGTNGEFVEPIPFLESRVKNMNKNGLSQINYGTDYFSVVKC